MDRFDRAHRYELGSEHDRDDDVAVEAVPCPGKRTLTEALVWPESRATDGAPRARPCATPPWPLAAARRIPTWRDLALLDPSMLGAPRHAPRPGAAAGGAVSALFGGHAMQRRARGDG